MEKLRIVFWGTPDFAEICLSKLLEVDFCEVVGVVTQPDRKVGRKQVLTPPPVKRLALENEIAVIQPERVKGNAEVLEQLNQWQPEVNVVVAYGHILPKDVLEVGKYGSVNVHGSLLPRYRGASPVQASLLNGDQTTGVTIMMMNEEMDAGDILSAEEIEIGEDETADVLMERLANVGGDLLVETLRRMVEGQITPLPQDHDEATFCEKIKRADGEVKWDQWTAKEIHDRLRAFTPWPGIFTNFEGKRLKILKASFSSDECEGKPGELVREGEKGAAFIAKSGLLLLEEVQLEGKQAMRVEDFVRGYLS